MYKKVISLTLILTIMVSLFSLFAPTNVMAEAIGEEKTIKTYVSKAQLEAELGVLTYVTPVMVSGAAGYIGGLVKSAASKGGVGLIIGALGVTLQARKAEIQRCLEKIAANNASGIVITDNFKYMYMNGSGTGWYNISTSIGTY